MFERYCALWATQVGGSVVLAACLSNGSHAADYQLDGGGPFREVFFAGDGYAAILNRYSVEPGLSLIDEIEFAWFNAAGAEAEVALWSDPNQDGVPDDAAVLWSTTIMGDGDGTISLLNVSVPSINVGVPGQNFFVGFVQHTILLDQVPYTFVDPDPEFFEPSQGFAASSLTTPLDASNLSDPSLHRPIEPIEDGSEFPWTLVIRANGIPGAGTGVIGALCVGLLGVRRHRVARRRGFWF